MFKFSQVRAIFQKLAKLFTLTPKQVKYYELTAYKLDGTLTTRRAVEIREKATKAGETLLMFFDLDAQALRSFHKNMVQSLTAKY